VRAVPWRGSVFPGRVFVLPSGGVELSASSNSYVQDKRVSRALRGGARKRGTSKRGRKTPSEPVTRICLQSPMQRVLSLVLASLAGGLPAAAMELTTGSPDKPLVSVVVVTCGRWAAGSCSAERIACNRRARTRHPHRHPRIQLGALICRSRTTERKRPNPASGRNTSSLRSVKSAPRRALALAVMLDNLSLEMATGPPASLLEAAGAGRGLP